MLHRETDNFDIYNTSIERWVCGCPYFLTNRFMICKHLVNLYGLIDAQDFKSIRRNNTYPFLIIDNSSIKSQQHTVSVLSFQNVQNISYDENNGEGNSNVFEEMIGTTKRALEILEEQKELQNISWTHGIE